MLYRTYTQLVSDIHLWSAKLPKFAAVCGIPRSGLIPASLLALRRNIQCVSLDSLLDNKKPWKEDLKGLGRDVKAADGPVLIIDDTVSSGGKMREVKSQLKDKGDFRYAAYGAIGENGKKEVDYFCIDMGSAFNICEWNIFHHLFNDKMLVDFDGVLCPDWGYPHEEGDLTELYQKHLDNALCLIKPTNTPLLGIVTARLEKHRKSTEAWLKKNGIEYHFLSMCPCSSPAEREAKNDSVNHKIRVYQKHGRLFVESDRNQSNIIHRHTGKPVLSWLDQTYLD